MVPPRGGQWGHHPLDIFVLVMVAKPKISLLAHILGDFFRDTPGNKDTKNQK